MAVRNLTGHAMSLDAESLLRSQHEMHGRIARSLNNLKKTGLSKVTSGAVESRLKLLDSYWARFEGTHESLRSTHWKVIVDHEYTQGNLYGAVEEIYVQQRATLVDLLEEFKRKVSYVQDTSARKESEGASRKQLPRIQLPTFSGKFEEWPAFKDLFQSIIERDSSLTDVEKLHYLRTSLKGDAVQLTRNVPTTMENYQRVWSMLVDHYANKRLLVRSCLASFTALPKLKGESASELRRLFHCVLQTVGTMEGIGRPIDASDLFVHLIVEMLDPRSRREWETNISGNKDPPLYSELKTFLEGRLHTLEALQTSEASTPMAKGGASARTARAHLAQKATKGFKCSLCKKEHYVLSCADFQAKSPGEQKEFAEAHNLCLNCFGRHQLATCPS